ncbi:TPA: RepB family plasmid replication initiator protein [Legionella pneumophila]|nr:RepB family plasmid replication initiator protein [Legionella pneumophila]HAT8257809.1 RepB family plasmid replication initiator protein [Legionella pneumophila]HAT8260543.1 RepB family plasmid replication initiator protein [Legionella pneumophila]HAT8270149.1 RepB family plasmid replication initiator protein [Legionella pneumophila]HAT8273110.1 RepB family plasmid replication initiator protein [Legionella pneumophila]
MEKRMGSVAINNKSLELKKHVNAIHCSNNLSLVQRKLFNALLFNAYPDLPYKQQFEIKGKDLYQLIGYNSKDTAKLKEALIGLITIAIEWNVIDCSTGQEKKWKASSILASAELSNGVCIYEYSQVMKDLMYQPEIYGQINIELISKFKSGYGLALYENCIRYKGLAQTPWFPLDIFRKLMGVFDGKYQVFKDFKKRVLDVGVNEVNTVSPIRIFPEIERVNQKVTRIRFKLEKNVDESPIPLNNLSIDEELKQLLINTFGFSTQMIEETYAKYDNNYIREKVEIITQSESFIAGKIRGLAGYLIEALKKDYKHSKSSKALINERRKISEAKEKEKKEKQEAQTERYRQYVNKKINNYLTNLTEDQKSDLISEFENYIKTQSSILKNWYQKHKLEHPATKGCFHSFIRENKQSEVGNIISMEDYIELME